MSNKCLTCKKQSDGKKFTFKYKGFEFSVEPRDRILCRSCRIKSIKRTFDELSGRNSKFITMSKRGEIAVDWEFFLELKGMKDDSHATEMLTVLTHLGIMSDCYKKGAIMILGYNMVLNPQKFLFMRMEDAKQYAKLEFGQAQYDWYLVQINQVVKAYEIA